MHNTICLYTIPIETVPQITLIKEEKSSDIKINFACKLYISTCWQVAPFNSERSGWVAAANRSIKNCIGQRYDRGEQFQRVVPDFETKQKFHQDVNKVELD